MNRSASSMQHVGQVALKTGDLLVAINRGVGHVDHVPRRRLAAELLGEQDPRVGRILQLRRGRIEVVVAPLQVAVEVVEAAMGGQILRLIAEVPFAQDPRGVALRPQQVGRASFRGRRGRTPSCPSAVGRDHPFQPVTLLVAPGQQCGACRGAYRAGRVAVGEAGAMAGQRIDVGVGMSLAPYTPTSR